MYIKNRESIFKLTLRSHTVYVASFSPCTGHEGVSPRIGLRFLLSAIRCSLLKRDDVSICSSFLSSCTSLLPSLSVNLLFRRGCMHALKTREKEKEEGPTSRSRGHAGKSEREEAAVSANGTDLSYRLLSSDASGITFVRFAGVDDVVAHGVGVISTREGTYLPITVLLSLLPSARTYACIYSPSFFPLPFSSPSRFLFPPFYLFPPSVFPRSLRSSIRTRISLRSQLPVPGLPLHSLSILVFTLICTAT